MPTESAADDNDDRLIRMITIGLFVAITFMVVLLVFVATHVPTSEAPSVEWGFQRLDSSHVRITHRGGATVDADRIRVTVDGVDRYPGWSDQLDSGDSGTISAVRGSEVVVYWLPPSGGRRELATWAG